MPFSFHSYSTFGALSLFFMLHWISLYGSSVTPNACTLKFFSASTTSSLSFSFFASFPALMLSELTSATTASSCDCPAAPSSLSFSPWPSFFAVSAAPPKFHTSSILISFTPSSPSDKAFLTLVSVVRLSFSIKTTTVSSSGSFSSDPLSPLPLIAWLSVSPPASALILPPVSLPAFSPVLANTAVSENTRDTASITPKNTDKILNCFLSIFSYLSGLPIRPLYYFFFILLFYHQIIKINRINCSHFSMQPPRRQHEKRACDTQVLFLCLCGCYLRPYLFLNFSTRPPALMNFC